MNAVSLLGNGFSVPLPHRCVQISCGKLQQLTERYLANFLKLITLPKCSRPNELLWQPCFTFVFMPTHGNIPDPKMIENVL